MGYPKRRGRTMHPSQRTLAAINLFGGIAVLASYAHGLSTYAGDRSDLWGSVPIEIRPIYTVSMLAATIGYFLFTFFVLFRLDPDRVRIAKRLPYETFLWLYIGMLFPSALWMPLTFQMIAQPSDGLWLAIRAVLTLVGLASLALVAALLVVEPRESKALRRLALLGSMAFAFQTALLDAMVWPTFFAP
jgi:hypothetical protein